MMNERLIKDKIVKMQEELNRIVSADIEKDEVVKVSQELDNLINEYYGLIGS